jgi:hypothetical protein
MSALVVGIHVETPTALDLLRCGAIVASMDSAGGNPE